MSSQNNKRARLTTLMDEDKISNISDEIIGRILSRLPIKEMVRTSALSTKWRYRWASVPSLVFDEKSLPRSNDQGPISVETLASQIDRILLFHLGPVHKFVMFYYRNLPCKDIDKWIFYLSRHSIKEFSLRFSGPGSYHIHSSLFSCQSLTHLELSNCSLPTPPSTFKDFNCLKSLKLNYMVEVTQEALEKLINSSTVLERLTMVPLYGVDHLNIDAPNLIYLNISGQFVDVLLEKASRLSELHISVYHTNKNFQLENPVKYKHGNLITLMAGVPQISRLAINGHLLVYLATDNIPKALHVPCVNLTYLSITTVLFANNEVLAILCLLRSAPNLEKLQIYRCEEIEEDINESWGCFGDSLEWDWEWESSISALKLVTINDLMGTKNEMNFIRFVLLTSPALRSMDIKLFIDEYSSGSQDYRNKFEIVKKILCFKRASTEVEIRVSE